jgi:hypothetical protein
MNKYLKRILYMIAMYLIIILGYSPEVNLAAFRWLYILMLGLSCVGFLCSLFFWLSFNSWTIKNAENINRTILNESNMITYVLAIINMFIVIMMFYNFNQKFLMNFNIFFTLLWFPLLYDLRVKINTKLRGLL